MVRYQGNKSVGRHQSGLGSGIIEDGQIHCFLSCKELCTDMPWRNIFQLLARRKPVGRVVTFSAFEYIIINFPRDRRDEPFRICTWANTSRSVFRLAPHRFRLDFTTLSPLHLVEFLTREAAHILAPHTQTFAATHRGASTASRPSLPPSPAFCTPRPDPTPAGKAARAQSPSAQHGTRPENAADGGEHPLFDEAADRWSTARQVQAIPHASDRYRPSSTNHFPFSSLQRVPFPDSLEQVRHRSIRLAMLLQWAERTECSPTVLAQLCNLSIRELNSLVEYSPQDGIVSVDLHGLRSISEMTIEDDAEGESYRYEEAYSLINGHEDLDGITTDSMTFSESTLSDSTSSATHNSTTDPSFIDLSPLPFHLHTAPSCVSPQLDRVPTRNFNRSTALKVPYDIRAWKTTWKNYLTAREKGYRGPSR